MAGQVIFHTFCNVNYVFIYIDSDVHAELSCKFKFHCKLDISSFVVETRNTLQNIKQFPIQNKFT